MRMRDTLPQELGLVLLACVREDHWFQCFKFIASGNAFLSLVVRKYSYNIYPTFIFKINFAADTLSAELSKACKFPPKLVTILHRVHKH